MVFKRIGKGIYQCVEHPNFSAKKVGRIWIGYDERKLSGGTKVCCCGKTLKFVKKAIDEYANGKVWYER